MNDLLWLSEDQLSCIKRYFPYPHGKPRVDDRRVISGAFRGVMRPKTTVRTKHCIIALYVVEESGPPERLMIDATHFKAHRTAARLG